MHDGDSGAVLKAARRALAIEGAGILALEKALDGPLGAAFVAAVHAMRDARGRVILTGIGKSGHVARKIAATLASTGTPSYFVHPAEASHGDLGMIGDDDVILALSWSGEAPELSDLVAYSRRFGVTLIAITAERESALGRAADIALVLPKMPEACPNGLAPTTSTTMELAAGDALAVVLLSLKGFTAQDFRRFHPGGRLGARLKTVGDLMHRGESVPVVVADAPLARAIDEIGARGFGATAVVDGRGTLVGIITDGDLRRALARGLVTPAIDEVMTRDPLTIGEGDLAEEALALMNRRAITCLFIIADGRPVGILHMHDLLRAGLM